jgi:head-tail adaptor
MKTAVDKNRKLELYSDSSTRSSTTGARKPAGTKVADVWANVDYRYGDERSNSQRQGFVQQVNITINYRSGITNTHYLKDATSGEVFDVLGVKPRDGRRVELILQTELRN